MLFPAKCNQMHGTRYPTDEKPAKQAADKRDYRRLIKAGGAILKKTVSSVLRPMHSAYWPCIRR